MDKNHLQKEILESKYERSEWIKVLREWFGVKQINQNPQPISRNTNDWNDYVENAYELGRLFTDGNEREVGIFEVKLTSSPKIAINRVKLRSLLSNIYGNVDGALIVFTQDDKWRFSYVSEILERDANDNVVCVKTEPKRYTYFFGKGENCRTASNRFDKLKGKPLNLTDLTEAFSVEKLSKEFFKTYKEHFEKFWKFLANDEDYYDLLSDQEKDDKDKRTKPIRDFVKILLGRLVFLQFLQKKGWMGVPASRSDYKGGDLKFNQNLFARFTDKDNFHSTALRTLFFETLNQKRPNDHADNSLGENIKIPYLNGGLFDKDVSAEHAIDFPADYFRDLLDFFEQYNFTIDESDAFDREVGIDPEMLGHIFENLLEENREKGAFYTPKEIVHYMCQESLIEYLSTNLSGDDKSDIELLVRHNIVSESLQNDFKRANKINDLLKAVKICDPAIGSGAFPMGLLKEIFECRRLLFAPARLEDFNAASIKKEIIQNNIYGVDIEPGAVDIARLRFWLSLVVDEEEPQPLPNLDYKIMQGNSLLERFDDIDLSELISAKEETDEIMISEQGSLVFAEGTANPVQITFFDQAAKQTLFDLISKYFDLDEWEKHHQEKLNKSALKRQINDLVEGKIHAYVFDKKKKLEGNIERYERKLSLATDGKINEKTKDYREYLKQKEQLIGLDETETKLIALQESVEKPYFLWHLWFKDVFDKNGFDIVIGNPPYLRVQGLREIDSAYTDTLIKFYKSATGSFDIYVTFLEMGLSLINSKGVLNYIMPVKWTNAAFGVGLRQIIFENKFAHKIVNFGSYQVFNASTYTGLQWFKRNSEELQYFELDKDLKSNVQLEEYLKSLPDTEKALIPHSKLTKDSWVLTIGKTSQILDKLNRQPRRLSDIFEKIFQGLATSKDDVYFLYNCETEGNCITGFSKQLNKSIKIERAFTKPLLKGEDVHKYDFIKTNRAVIFPYKLIDGEAILYKEEEIKKEFPLAYNYLKLCEDVLRDREKGRFNIDGEWFQFGRKQGISSAEKEKLLAPEISLGGNFAYDKYGEFYSTTTIYGYIKKTDVKESYKTLLPIMNSKVFWWYLVNTGTVLANGYFRYKPNYIKTFPIPIVPQKTEIILEDLVDKISLAKKSNSLENYAELETQLEKIVCELYDLDSNEILIMNNSK